MGPGELSCPINPTREQHAESSIIYYRLGHEIGSQRYHGEGCNQFQVAVGIEHWNERHVSPGECNHYAPEERAERDKGEGKETGGRGGGKGRL